MVNPVGVRFLPTDEEIFDHYIRLKNLSGSNTSLVDQVINTVNICDFDPWELPTESRMKSDDQVWYFFRLKKKKYNTGTQQMRKTKSGYWKKTGRNLKIKRMRGHQEKIGEKSVLVFEPRGSRPKWVMHEYDAIPIKDTAYIICKVFIKDEAREVSSPGTEIVAHSDSPPTHMNNELITGSEQQEPAELEEEVQEASDSVSSFDWKSFLNDG